MSGSKGSKEELLNLLTDIHQQLLELDHALEKYFANYREQLEKRRRARLAEYQCALQDLEKNFYRKRASGVRKRVRLKKRGKLGLKRNYSGYLYENSLM